MEYNICTNKEVLEFLRKYGAKKSIEVGRQVDISCYGFNFDFFLSFLSRSSNIEYNYWVKDGFLRKYKGKKFNLTWI